MFAGIDGVALLVGVVVIGVGLHLARDPRKLGVIIHDYYANIARRKRNWWGPLSWQQVPGYRTSLALAWVLIASGLAMGAYFIFLGLSDN